MLDLDDEEAREGVAGPGTVEVVRLVLLYPVVAINAEPGAVHAGLGGIRRLRSEPAEVVREMPVEDHERVARFRVLVEPFGEEDVSPQMHGPAPELGEQPALDLDVLDVFRFRRIRNLGHDPIERDPNRRRGSRIEVDPVWRAVEIPRCPPPILSLAAVHRQLHRVPGGEVEGLVPVEHGLHVVSAGGNVVEALHGIPEHRSVDRDGCTGCHFIDVDSEDLCGSEARRHLIAGLAPIGCREYQNDPAVQGTRADRRRERNDHTRRGVDRGGRSHRPAGSEQQQAAREGGLYGEKDVGHHVCLHVMLLGALGLVRRGQHRVGSDLVHQ